MTVLCRIILRLSSIIHDPQCDMARRFHFFRCVCHISNTKLALSIQGVLFGIENVRPDTYRNLYYTTDTIRCKGIWTIEIGHIWDYYKEIEFHAGEFLGMSHTQVSQDVGPAYIIHATDIYIYILSHYLQQHPAKVDKPNQIVFFVLHSTYHTPIPPLAT